MELWKNIPNISMYEMDKTRRVEKSDRNFKTL